MKFVALFGFGIGWCAVSAVAAPAQDASLAGNPYAVIVSRNIFNLVPIPTNNPADEVKQPDPPAKITPNGIMKLFGVVQVLFKVATPARPGQPQQEQSYCLSEGDRQDGIEVIKIDEAAKLITFDNNGILQKLPLTEVGDTGGTGSGPGGASPDRAYHGRFAGGGPGSPGGRFGGLPSSEPVPTYESNPQSNGDSAPSPSPYSASPEAAQARIQSVLNDPNHFTPEAQVIMMEANRQQLQAQGDPTAALIPPTAITEEVQGGGDANPNETAPPPP